MGPKRINTSLCETVLCACEPLGFHQAHTHICFIFCPGLLLDSVRSRSLKVTWPWLHHLSKDSTEHGMSGESQVTSQVTAAESLFHCPSNQTLCWNTASFPKPCSGKSPWSWSRMAYPGFRTLPCKNRPVLLDAGCCFMKKCIEERNNVTIKRIPATKYSI